MKKLTISEIESRLDSILDQADPFIVQLGEDERKGVQTLLARWRKKKAQIEKEKTKFLEMCCYEKKYRAQGFERIAGIDEVGRGPLAGPVVAAAVILPKNFYLPGIDDSKKLSELKREEYAEIIQQKALAVSIGMIGVEEIDQINILEASKKAMLAAISDLSMPPDFLLVDAVKLATPFPNEAIIKGDAKSISIAAASIVAKVTRDRLMRQMDQEVPQYRFSQNMGYGTKEHLQALEQYGATKYHRKSFSPVKNVLERKR